jgi:hypothetical protein
MQCGYGPEAIIIVSSFMGIVMDNYRLWENNGMLGWTTITIFLYL